MRRHAESRARSRSCAARPRRGRSSARAARRRHDRHRRARRRRSRAAIRDGPARPRDSRASISMRALVREAIAAGARVRAGVAVRDALIDERAAWPRVSCGVAIAGDGRTLRVARAGDDRRRRPAVDAGVRHSAWRGIRARRGAGRSARTSRTCAGHCSSLGEMHIRRGRYIGVAPLPGGLTNVCLVKPSGRRRRRAARSARRSARGARRAIRVLRDASPARALVGRPTCSVRWRSTSTGADASTACCSPATPPASSIR